MREIYARERQLEKERNSCPTIKESLALTYAADPRVRLQATKSLCPCTTRNSIDVVWDRLFELSRDDDPRVREQALHDLCDGTPKELEERVVEMLERAYNDPSESLRKRARRALNSYRRTGNWNVL